MLSLSITLDYSAGWDKSRWFAVSGGCLEAGGDFDQGGLAPGGSHEGYANAPMEASISNSSSIP